METIKLTKTIKHIITCLEKNINLSLKEKDLSFSQGVILAKISQSEHGEISLKDLEKLFAVAQSTMFGVILRLEKKGLVETYLSDKKIKFAKITVEGNKLVPFIIDTFQSTEMNLFDGFTTSEQSQFISLLKRIETNATDC